MTRSKRMGGRGDRTKRNVPQPLRPVGAPQPVRAAALPSDIATELYQAVFEGSYDGIFLSDAKSGFVAVNRAAADLTGYAREELLRTRMSDLLEEQDRTACELLPERTPAGECFTSEVCIRRKDGAKVETELRSRRIIVAEKTYVHTVARDITDRKQTEEESKNRIEELTALSRGARQLTESVDKARVAENITQTCVQTFGVCLAWLLRAESDGSMRHISSFPAHVKYPAEVAIRWNDSPLGRGPTGRAVRSGEPVVFADLGAMPDYVPWREPALKQGFATSAAFPLINGGKTFGCLNLYSDCPGFFSPKRVEFFQAFASQAAAAMENAHLFSSPNQEVDEHRQTEEPLHRDEAGNVKRALITFQDVTRLKEAKHSLEMAHVFLNTVLDSFPGNVAVLDEKGHIAMTNEGWTTFGRANGLAPEFLWQGIDYLDVARSVKGQWSEGASEACEAIEAILRGEENEFHMEYSCHSPDKRRWFDMLAQGFSHEGRRWVVIAHVDVTERKESELDRELSLGVLGILNRAENQMEIVRDILKLLKTHVGFTAVAIRLRDGDDYPYFVQNGFPDDFVREESPLCVRTPEGDLVRDEEGRPVLECMCGSVIRGRVDPSQPLFTEGGSFWTNGTTEFLATAHGEDRQARPRNGCKRQGYESVALIPLRSGDQVIGLLQMNDLRPGRFTEEMIRFFEGLGASIGIAISRRDADEALRASGKRFHAMFESSPIAIWEEDFSEVKARFDELRRSGVTDFSDYLDRNPAEVANLAARVRVLAVNQTSVNVLGAASKEQVRHELPRYFTSASLEVFKKEVVALAEGRTCFRSESPHLNSRGEPLVFDLTLSVQPGFENTLSRVLVSFVDITERMQTQEALRKSEEKYRALFENMAAASCLDEIVYEAGKAVDYRILDINPSFERLTGITKAQAVGALASQLYGTREIPFLDIYAKIAQTGKPTSFDAFFPPIEKYLHITASCPAKGRFSTVITDITDRILAREELDRGRAELTAIYEHAPVMMCVLDADRRVLYANREFTEFTGVSGAELRSGRACGVFGCINALTAPRRCGFGDRCQDCHLRRALEDTLSTGIGHRDVEYQATLENDGIRRNVVLLGSIAAIRTDQRPKVLLCLQDITRRKAVEEQLLNYGDRLRELAARLTMAEERERRRVGLGLHDNVGQSLAMMKFALQALGKTADEATGKRLGQICDETDRLMDVIRLLSFELSDSILYTMGLKEAVEAYLMREIRQKHGITYRLEVQDDFPRLAEDLRVPLFRNLREVLVNVVKHAKAKHVEIALTASEDTLAIDVKDDGVGFDPAVVAAELGQKHFGIFSIEQQLGVLGGRIEIRSTPGQGACVTMMLPRPNEHGFEEDARQ